MKLDSFRNIGSRRAFRGARSAQCHTTIATSCRIEDIEALLITAKQLALRFRGPELQVAAASIEDVLGHIRDARGVMMESWQRGG